MVRRFPMIPGIDFVGMVETSTHPDWKPGDGRKRFVHKRTLSLVKRGQADQD